MILGNSHTVRRRTEERVQIVIIQNININLATSFDITYPLFCRVPESCAYLEGVSIGFLPVDNINAAGSYSDGEKNKVSNLIWFRLK